MTDDHARTMTNICRFAPNCSRPFGRIGCESAWCFGPMMHPGQKMETGTVDRPQQGPDELKGR